MVVKQVKDKLITQKEGENQLEQLLEETSEKQLQAQTAFNEQTFALTKQSALKEKQLQAEIKHDDKSK